MDSENHTKLRCLSDERDRLSCDPEGVWSFSALEQIDVEESVGKLYEKFKKKVNRADDKAIPQELYLKKSQLIDFLVKGLSHLSEGYGCLDASRPWLCFWILHSMELLDVQVDEETKSQIALFLSKCQSESGGFAGGPGQLPHLAPTYAAVMALCILGTEEAYQYIDRKSLYQYLLSMHQEDGSFIMHEGGEVDIRGCYLAASVAQITNIASEELFDKTPQWIVSCQTYEGGFGGVPGMEAHGGYAFCGIAALSLLGHERLCDIDLLQHWLVNRQMRLEGGFQGRTNKLVDSCYSYWQSAIAPIISSIPEYKVSDWLFNNGALQEYLLLCCQHPAGGFIDKPGKHRDYYHTCYSLSGLSISQHFNGQNATKPHIIGPNDNLLVPTHPVYNLGVKSVFAATEYFKKLPKVH